MRAGGMYQAFSCFLLSLSPFPSYTAVGQAVLNILSYFILQPAINFKLFSSHLQWWHTIHDIRMHIRCQMDTFAHLAWCKEKRNERFSPQTFTCANLRGNMLLPPSTFMHHLIQFHVPWNCNNSRINAAFFSISLLSVLMVSCYRSIPTACFIFSSWHEVADCLQEEARWTGTFSNTDLPEIDV